MKASAPEPEIVTKNGKPVSVILPIKRYQEIMERLDDAEDVAWLKKARRKKLHYRPLEEVLADRGAHLRRVKSNSGGTAIRLRPGSCRTAPSVRQLHRPLRHRIFG